MNLEYKICSRCVMDTSALDITFDENGHCNYCSDFLKNSSHIIFKDPTIQKQELDNLITKIKKSGKGKRYDCIVGVSGGVDSSWALVKAVELGLKPLAVHMDNGWNSELAQNNIANLVRGLNVDLYTHVIDWDEYRNLMQAFFDANVIDIELLYDNAMLAVTYGQASKQGLKYILTGYNKATEGILLPRAWTWNKFDKRNIYALTKQFGGTKIKTFPALGSWDYAWLHYIKLIQANPFLDYFPYNKFESLKVLQEKYGYKPYPYKHYESIFTRFYQGYILPEKFGVDKRKVHLATLVISGQITREDALKSISEIPYPSLQALEEDKIYFLKKMGWTKQQLEEYLKKPEVLHDFYPSERKLYETIANLPNMLPTSLKVRITNLIKSIR
jgi:N-acetyl sugar amidotransferase